MCVNWGQSYKANFGVNCIQLEVASSYFMLHINVRVVCDNSRDVYETSFLKAHSILRYVQTGSKD